MSRVLQLLVALLAIMSIVGGVFFISKTIIRSKTKAGLQVITQDVSSSLFFDGQYLDKTPFISKQIQPGEHTLTIQPDDPNLTSYETTITLTKGLITVVTWKPASRPETSGGVIYEMDKLKNKKGTMLSFITIPDNAIIKLDDRGQEFSPLTITDVSPGHHQFEVTLPSYETQKHTINVVEGHRIQITVKLAKLENPQQDPLTAVASPSPSTSLSTSSDSSTATTSALSISGPKVTIETTNFFQDGIEVLRVRDKAGPGGKELGFAEVGKSYPYLDETKSSWYKIDFEGEEAWVSGQYSKLEE